MRKDTRPSQSPEVTALPKGEPRMDIKMERIGIDTLHLLVYEHHRKNRDLPM